MAGNKVTDTTLLNYLARLARRDGHGCGFWVERDGTVNLGSDISSMGSTPRQAIYAAYCAERRKTKTKGDR